MKLFSVGDWFSQLYVYHTKSWYMYQLFVSDFIKDTIMSNLGCWSFVKQVWNEIVMSVKVVCLCLASPLLLMKFACRFEYQFACFFFSQLDWWWWHACCFWLRSSLLLHHCRETKAVYQFFRFFLNFFTFLQMLNYVLVHIIFTFFF